MKYKLLMVGTDAEVFLRHQSTKQPVPVTGKLGGTKMKPLAVLSEEGFAVQEDNVMAEFNVPPAETAKRFARNIHVMMGFLRKKMACQQLQLAVEASMQFPEEALNHFQAQQFGCDPDICAWSNSTNAVNRFDPLLKTMRTAAAHIHVSYLVDDQDNFGYDERCLAVRAHDLFVGVPGILLDPDVDRRKIYGKAGAFRVTDYGHEYRTPSNFWIKTPQLREWVFEQTGEALNFISDDVGRKILMDDKTVIDAIQVSINEHDTKTAEWLCNEFCVNVP